MILCPSCGSSETDFVDEDAEEMNCAGCGLDFPLTEGQVADDEGRPVELDEVDFEDA